MSDYWVSRNKWYCKYCNVYIADDKPSRLHHETGMRHKGNLERYIRDIYKKGQQKEKDKADEAKELSAIEAAAAKAMGLSVEDAASTARAASGSPAPPATDKSAAPAPVASTSSSDPYSNYSTAESLGYIDLEAQKAQREKEAREKERELREKEGRAGEWTLVSNHVPTSRAATAGEADAEGGETSSAESRMTRAMEDPDRKKISFSYLKEKALPVDDDDDEYNKIAIKVRPPKFIRAPANPLSKAMDQARTQAPPGGPKSSAKANAQLAKMKFRPVEASGEHEEEEDPEELLARQQAAWDLISPPQDAVKQEEEAAAASSSSTPMFKKKRKVGGADSEGAKRRAA